MSTKKDRLNPSNLHDSFYKKWEWDLEWYINQFYEYPDDYGECSDEEEEDSEEDYELRDKSELFDELDQLRTSIIDSIKELPDDFAANVMIMESDVSVPGHDLTPPNFDFYCEPKDIRDALVDFVRDVWRECFNYMEADESEEDEVYETLKFIQKMIFWMFDIENFERNNDKVFKNLWHMKKAPTMNNMYDAWFDFDWHSDGWSSWFRWGLDIEDDYIDISSDESWEYVSMKTVRVSFANFQYWWENNMKQIKLVLNVPVSYSKDWQAFVIISSSSDMSDIYDESIKTEIVWIWEYTEENLYIKIRSFITDDMALSLNHIHSSWNLSNIFGAARADTFAVFTESIIRNNGEIISNSGGYGSDDGWWVAPFEKFNFSNPSEYENSIQDIISTVSEKWEWSTSFQEDEFVKGSYIAIINK